MNKASSKLTVFFEDSFWVGVFEKIENEKLSVEKVTFGAEPKDYEVLEYIIKYYHALQFSPDVTTMVKKVKRNPKSVQRDARKQMLKTGVGTKSQQALKLQQEQISQERIQKTRKRKEEERIRLFEMKQQKRRKKHKGH